MQEAEKPPLQKSCPNFEIFEIMYSDIEWRKNVINNRHTDTKYSLKIVPGDEKINSFVARLFFG